MAAEALDNPPVAAAAEPSPAESVLGDPNFAVVCAFIDRFGALCGLQCPNIGDLQAMLEATEVKQDWIMFQVSQPPRNVGNGD